MKNMFTTGTLMLLMSVLSFQNVSSQTVGQKAPDFTLTSTDGSTFNLSENKGKVIVIFVIGYSCPLCKSSAPSVESELYNTFKSSDDFILFGMDVWDGSVGQVASFKSWAGVTFPLYVKAGSTGSKYGTVKDKLLVIDSEGYLVHKTNNPAYQDVDEVKDLVINELKMLTDINSVNESKNISVSNYPNPFSSKTSITYQLKKSGNVKIALYDLSGKKVENIENNYVQAGEYSVDFYRNNLTRGMYILSVEMDNKKVIHKMIVQ